MASLLRGRARFAVVVSLAQVAPASAGPVLHEYFDADAQEDIELGATTTDGALPAAIQTQSGVVRAPEAPTRPTSTAPPGITYGGASSSASDGSSYQIDADTTQPELVTYDDPFSPSIPPFKRLYAYDAVDESFELVVENRVLTALPIGGTPKPEDDQFYASMPVDLVPNTPARVPSVGPSTNAIAASTTPRVDLELLRDSADNWFVRSESGGRVQLTFHLAIRRDAFGSDFRDVAYADLRGYLPRVPAVVRDAGRAVAAEIGIDEAERPRDAIATLIDHFRGFAPSSDRPSSQGADLYRDISLSRRGVCRHRSYSFMITSLALGIPSRFVHNEAHAWVEVFDSDIWHRIDLGGAAGGMTMRTSGPRHVTPRDPYRWPSGADSASTLASHAAETGAGGNAVSTGNGASNATSQSSRNPGDAPDNAPPPATDDTIPSGTVVIIESPPTTSFRGGRVQVSGTVENTETPCRRVRVDFSLRDSGGGQLPLGTLVTDERGKFSGKLVVPFSATLGDYAVTATTPGNAECGHGSTATADTASDR